MIQKKIRPKSKSAGGGTETRTRTTPARATTGNSSQLRAVGTGASQEVTCGRICEGSVASRVKCDACRKQKKSQTALPLRAYTPLEGGDDFRDRSCQHRRPTRARRASPELQGSDASEASLRPAFAGSTGVTSGGLLADLRGYLGRYLSDTTRKTAENARIAVKTPALPRYRRS